MNSVQCLMKPESTINISILSIKHSTLSIQHSTLNP